MKHPRLQLNKRAFWCGVAVLVLLRCGLTGFQQAYTWVGGAPLDDELMFRAAQAITAGEWLGAYDYLTLSKAMFFPVWLALLHVLHLPYLVSGAALWCAASLLAAFAFAPLWRNAEPGCGRVLTLGLFGALAFLPSGWAAYTLRVYRDNIFPALCLVFFAGMAGMAGPCFTLRDKSRCGPGCWRRAWGWLVPISTARTRGCSCFPLPGWRPSSCWWCWLASAGGSAARRRLSRMPCWQRGC